MTSRSPPDAYDSEDGILFDCIRQQSERQSEADKLVYGGLEPLYESGLTQLPPVATQQHQPSLTQLDQGILTPASGPDYFSGYGGYSQEQPSRPAYTSAMASAGSVSSRATCPTSKSCKLGDLLGSRKSTTISSIDRKTHGLCCYAERHERPASPGPRHASGKAGSNGRQPCRCTTPT